MAAVPEPAVVPPTPRGAHLEMVGAVLVGEGLERVAEIASAHAGAPVAVIVPRLGVPLEGWAKFERYVGARLAGSRPQRPAEVVAEVPISSWGRELGAVLLLGQGRADAGEYLHWSGDSRRLHWALGPELFTRALPETFAFVPGAPEKLPDQPK